jgi:type IV secretory pathway TrbF-like protein
MATQHKSTVYKPLEIKNPFHDGDKAYADILADKMKETQVWRKLTFVNIVLFFISLVLFFYSVSRQQTVPVLINVMPSGESQYLGEVRQTGSVQVPKASVHYQIRTFILNYRTVSTDYQIVYSNIDDCFAMVTQDYTPIFRQALVDNSPFSLVGKIRRTVEIESILLITGRPYNVNWTESSYDASASHTTAKMRAVVTIRLVTPTDATIKRNPLGIYIENFEMTEL